MPFSTQQTSQELIQKAHNVDIVQVIASSGVKLELQGSVYRGICPLHDDKDSPSLVVYPRTNSWYCFGKQCQNGGDTIHWLRLLYGMSFGEAVQSLVGLNTSTSKLVAAKQDKPRVVPPDNILYWHGLLNEKR